MKIVTRLVRFFLVGGVFIAAPTALAGLVVTEPVEKAADEVIDLALQDEVGLRFVEDLTTIIGPRLAGSEAEARARAWSAGELNRLGFDNVRIEAFTIPYWSRVTETAVVAGEHPQPLTITALGGSKATPAGGITANIARFDSLRALEKSPADSLTGKIVFIDEKMEKTQNGAGYGLAVRKRSQCASVAADKGAAACLIRSVGTQTHRMAHTGIMAREGATGALPAAALSPPDADQLTRLLERGPVAISLNISVETATAAPSGNVIAEIEGTDLKDEIVLISCHLDSWDPGTGALDDGAGCGIVIGAAHVIANLAEKPRRTVRIVLYGAEEVGLFGGDAYARQHAGDLADHVLAAESDFGAGRIWQFQTRFGDGAMAYASAMQNVLQRLAVAPGNNQAFGGPDIGVLARSGVPVVTPAQDGTDYFDYHHTPDDTFDKIDPETFQQNVAVYAAFTYMAASTDWDFRQPAANARATE